MQKLGLLLREFRDRLSTDVPLPPDCDLFFCSEEAPTVCLGSMIHGNEFGSLPALVELQRQLREGRIQPQVNIFLLFR